MAMSCARHQATKTSALRLGTAFGGLVEGRREIERQHSVGDLDDIPACSGTGCRAVAPLTSVPFNEFKSTIDKAPGSEQSCYIRSTGKSTPKAG
jgi:hypothetical protein